MSHQWEPLHRERFAPFGEVIEVGGGTATPINNGTTIRHSDLAKIDVGEGGRRPVISIFETRPFGFPLEIEALERHPLSSQAFVPLDDHPFMVVVAPPGDAVKAGEIRVFRTNGAQGVNFRRGVWHHPAIVTVRMRFLVIDRGVEEGNCDVFTLPKGDTFPILEPTR
jgi:ureidoglycolate lyase